MRSVCRSIIVLRPCSACDLETIGPRSPRGERLGGGLRVALISVLLDCPKCSVWTSTQRVTLRPWLQPPRRARRARARARVHARSCPLPRRRARCLRSEQRQRGLRGRRPLLRPISPAAPRFIRYEAGGASTATSAAIRTSINVCSHRGSSRRASPAVISASRSRTGVWLVCSAIIAPFVFDDPEEPLDRGVEPTINGTIWRTRHSRPTVVQSSSPFPSEIPWTDEISIVRTILNAHGRLVDPTSRTKPKLVPLQKARPRAHAGD